MQKTVVFKQFISPGPKASQAYYEIFTGTTSRCQMDGSWGCHFFATPCRVFSTPPAWKGAGTKHLCIFLWQSKYPPFISSEAKKNIRRNYIWNVDGRVIYLLSALPSIWSLNNFQKQINAHNNPHTVDLWCFTGIWINPVLLVLFWQGESQWITMTAATNISQILWVLPKPCNSSVHEG